MKTAVDCLKTLAQYNQVKERRRKVELCLEENERRMARYDPRLVPPQFLPRLAWAACAATFLPRE